MRKGALLLALVFAVASVSTADAAKKRRAATMVDPAVQAQQDTANFLGDALHPWAPANSEPAMRKPRKKKKKSG